MANYFKNTNPPKGYKRLKYHSWNDLIEETKQKLDKPHTPKKREELLQQLKYWEEVKKLYDPPVENPSTKIQSILFDRAKYSLAAARQWLKAHKYKSGSVDTKDHYFHFRQFAPSKLLRYFTIAAKNSNGVKFVVAAAKNPRAGSETAIDNPSKIKPVDPNLGYDDLTYHQKDLFLYAENDSDLYRQQKKPIEDNLWKKFKKGTYDHSKAPILWKYFLDNAAKKYNRDLEDKKVFTPDDRRAVAQVFANQYYDEMKYELEYQKTQNPSRGSYRHRIPRSAVKKYLDFTQKNKAKISTAHINLPKNFIFIGKAVNIDYVSDKFDGKKRLYTHKLKTHGDILITPSGRVIMITGLKLRITSRGLEG